MKSQYSDSAASAVAATIHAALAGRIPSVALILGSGLSGLADAVHDSTRIPYTDIPTFPDVQVSGHPGQLVIGSLEGVQVLIFAGRFHLYEGHPASLVGFPVRLAHALGAGTLIVSSAMGAINRKFAPGDLMIVTDHINLTGTSPLIGSRQEGDVYFPDMSNPYDARLRDTLRAVARRLNISIREGVYASLLGPAYETPAEIRMLRMLGADAVCMSAVPEVITAHALSMRVAGIGCITNMASGMSNTSLDHADVLQAAARASGEFHALIKGLIADERTSLPF
jgi:purine-nucleoside phosphorylase